MLVFVGLFVHHERQTGGEAPLLSAIASCKASDATSLHSSSSQKLSDLLDKLDDVSRNFQNETDTRTSYGQSLRSKR